VEYFTLSSPEVLRLRAAQGGPEDMETHFNWYVSFDAEPFDVEGVSHYPIIGTLHAGSASGWGDISLGALLMVVREIGKEPLPDVIARSNAVETLYDVARGHLSSLLRTAGAVFDIPSKSPPVEVMEFDEEDEGDSASDEAGVAGIEDQGA